MELNCPECRQRLRIANELADRVIRCPLCGAIFQTNEHATVVPARKPERHPAQPSPAPSAPVKALYLAIDVSTSTRASLPGIHRHLTSSLAQIRQQGPYSLAFYLFHRHVMPFPSEALCRPLPYEEAAIPTLADLEQRVGAGTAILDAIDRLIEHALADRERQTQPTDRRVIIMTDGWERSSKKADAEALTAKIARARGLVDVSMTGFVDGRSYGCLVDLARSLELPSDSWAFARHRGDEDSIHDSICSMSLALVRFAVLPAPDVASFRPGELPRQRGGSSSAPAGLEAKAARNPAEASPRWNQDEGSFHSSDFFGVGVS